MKYKGGKVNFLVVLLALAIMIVGIAIIYNVMTIVVDVVELKNKPLPVENPPIEIEPINVDIKIDSAYLINANKSIYLVLTRSGLGDIKNFRISFQDRYGVAINLNRNDYPLNGELKTYSIGSSEVLLNNFSKISKVILYYDVIQTNGEIKQKSFEKQLIPFSNITIRSSTPVVIRSSGGGGIGRRSSGGGCSDESISITCLNMVCGIKINNCGNSVSCGTCQSGAHCNNGQCISNNLIAYYPFESDANDYSGNNFHGIMNGTIISSGKVGNSIKFNGVNDSIFLPSNLMNNSLFGGNYGNITFISWVNLKNVAKSNILFNKLGGVNYLSPGSNLVGGSRIRSMIYDYNNKIFVYYTSNNMIANNTWVHIAFTIQGGVIAKYYINGTLDSNYTDNITLFSYLGSNSTNLGIGFDSNSYYSGQADEIKIYNKILTGSEIYNDFNCVPRICSQLSRVCGNLDDGCGKIISCGPCGSGQSCNSSGQCVGSCTAQSCTQLNKQCGNWDNGCGVNVNVTCGPCGTGQSCNSSGQCVGSCTAQSCTQLNKQCGNWDNGCGVNVNVTCGPCGTGQSCNSSGQCVGSCTAQSCTQLNKQCGNWDNGCGVNVNVTCGPCGTGQSCDNNGQCTTNNLYYNVSGCQDLNLSNKIYVMNRSFIPNRDPCIKIMANNITFDGNGYSLLKNNTDYITIISSRYNETKLNNLLIYNLNHDLLYGPFGPTIGIELYNSINNEIKNSHFSGGDYGISLYYVTNSSIKNNELNGLNYGMYELSGYKNIISNNSFLYNELGSITMTNSLFETIYNNDFSFTYNSPLFIASSSNSLNITKNQFNRSDHCLQLISSDYSEIGNNVFIDCERSMELTFSSNYNNIYLNTIKNQTTNLIALGLYLSESDHNMVNNNFMTGVGKSGTGISLSTSYYNSFDGNSFFYFSYGMLFSANSNYNTISYTSARNGSYGIYSQESSYNYYYYNKILSNEIYGYSIYNSNGLQIIGNNISYNNKSGIYLSNCNNSIIKDTSLFSKSFNDTVFIISSNNSLVNCSLNLSKEYDSLTGNHFRKWYYRAYVNNSLGNPIYNASVSVYNSSKNLIFQVNTDPSGYSPQLELIDYYKIGNNRYYYSNYTINVSFAGLNITRQYNITKYNNKYADVYTLPTILSSEIPMTTEVQLNALKNKTMIMAVLIMTEILLIYTFLLFKQNKTKNKKKRK